MHPSTEAYILVGGRSSRLGRDKAFVEMGGKTLAERTLVTVRESGIASKIFFVAGSEEQFAIEAIRLDTPFIFDLVEHRGPLGGLYTTLSNAASKWILLLACDYPLISPELLAFLATNIEDEFGAVVPEQSDGRLQPLCAFYNVKKALPVIDEIINRPHNPPPMHEVVRTLNAKILKYDEYSCLSGAEVLFENVNTPADLEKTDRFFSNKPERDETETNVAEGKSI